MAGKVGFRFLFVLLGLPLMAQGDTDWSVVRSAHFEVYSHQGEATARAALAWFEQLRAFFGQQTGLDLDVLPPVRVIGFRSAKEYEPYRLRPTADAYYAGTETRDYIVMETLDPSSFSIAAHEYAHLVLHAGALSLPSWLNEGLANFYSTLRVTPRGTTLGGGQTARPQVLTSWQWMPLATLVSLSADAPELQDRDLSALFYAESSVLAEMLVLAPAYAPRLPALLASLQGRTPSGRALFEVYGRTLEAIEKDLHAWAQKPRPEILVAGFRAEGVSSTTAALTPFDVRELMAELTFALGRLDAAESMYRDLARESPAIADILAALGTIALRRGNREAARREWRQAIERGASNAVLCFRYATLAADAGAGPAEIRPALERAVALNPEYDDARYSLALLEKNAGRYEDAISQLRAMRTVLPSRAFAYWSAVADSFLQLDRREEAKAAARKAGEYAQLAEERAHAAQIRYFADTDLAVRFARDAEGRQQLVTTRVPHGESEHNPFVEPGDDYRKVRGTLREIDCSSSSTRFRLETPDGLLTLAVADPSRVQMRNAPPEFTCGPQPEGPEVTVEYAARRADGADGVVRGLAFP